MVVLGVGVVESGGATDIGGGGGSIWRELLCGERKRIREREVKGGKEGDGGSGSLCSYSYSTPGLLQLCFFLKNNYY